MAKHSCFELQSVTIRVKIPLALDEHVHVLWQLLKSFMGSNTSMISRQK